MTTQARIAEINGRLAEAEKKATQRHAGHADAVHDALGGLRQRLERVHEQSSDAGEETWADYAAGLDRGLDELDSELDRTAKNRTAEEGEAGPTVEDVLAVHTSALELAGWRMRFSLPGASTDEVRSRLATADDELSRYRATRAAGRPASTESLTRSLAELRNSAGE